MGTLTNASTASVYEEGVDVTGNRFPLHVHQITPQAVYQLKVTVRLCQTTFAERETCQIEKTYENQ